MTDTQVGAKPTETHRFSFTGTAKEYFGIWIVNLLLSIVTLGIYTAWAKVRRLRYFYGNTWLDGHNFEYHAKPLQILIGRIIVVVVLVIFNVLANISPIISLIILIPYLLGLPWLINKALAFNARMTSYRNVRFSFEGSYGRAFWVFVVLPLIVPFVLVLLGVGAVAALGTNLNMFDPNAVAIAGGLGLAGFFAYVLFIPYISKKTNTYLAECTRFGTARFNADIGLTPLYRNLGVALLVSLAPVLLLGALVYLGFQGNGAVMAGGAGQALGLFVYVALIVGFLFYAAGVRNIAFNATTIEGGHALISNLSRRRYAWIILSNLVMSVVSIGLLIPWAAIRSWRYIIGQSGVETPGLDEFVADQEAQGNVTAAEYLDIDGIDFGI